MKNFKNKEWEDKKVEIIDEIESIENTQFRKSDFVAKIKRNIPKNSTNKSEIIDSLNDVGKGAFSMSFGGKSSRFGPTVDEQKHSLIEILDNIELIKFRVFKNVIYFIHKKIDWKWVIPTVLTVIGLLITMYWVK